MSKRFFLLGILGFFLTANTYAAVGKKNFVLKVSGGFDMSLMKAKPGSHFQIPETNQVYSSANLLGGSLAIELGVQYFGVSGPFVQGIDLLGSFGYSIESIRTPNFYIFVGTTDPTLEKMYISGSSTYSVGRQFSNLKLMFDVVGVNFSFGNLKAKSTAFDDSVISRVEYPGGGFWSAGVNLPLGMQFIMNNGLTLGFRHSISFFFPAYNTLNGFNLLKGDRSYDVLNYQLHVSLGFMVGK